MLYENKEYCQKECYLFKEEQKFMMKCILLLILMKNNSSIEFDSRMKIHFLYTVMHLAQMIFLFLWIHVWWLVFTNYNTFYLYRNYVMNAKGIQRLSSFFLLSWFIADKLSQFYVDIWFSVYLFCESIFIECNSPEKQNRIC